MPRYSSEDARYYSLRVTYHLDCGASYDLARERASRDMDNRRRLHERPTAPTTATIASIRENQLNADRTRAWETPWETAPTAATWLNPNFAADPSVYYDPFTLEKDHFPKSYTLKEREGSEIPMSKKCSKCNETKESTARRKISYENTGYTRYENNTHYDNVCNECFEKLFQPCAEEGCTEFVYVNSDYLLHLPERKNKRKTGKTFHYCRNHAKRCPTCGKKKRNAFFIDYPGVDVCLDCVKADAIKYCEGCKLLHRGAEYKKPGTEEHYCEGCATDFLPKCAICGVIESGSTPLRDFCEKLLCRNCISSTANESILSYSYKPEPIFIGEGIRMGCELEFEAEAPEGFNLSSSSRIGDGRKLRETAYSLRYFLKDDAERIYIKGDSSIQFGFEVVTHPATIEHMAELMKKIVPLLKERELQGDTERTGIHVHIERRHFTDTDLVKFGVFINTQRDNVEQIARRRNCGHSTYKDVDREKLTHREKHLRHFERVRMSVTRERHEAVNFQNANTVELRIFKGSSKYSEIMVCLEFSEASFLFVKTVSVPFLCDRPKAWTRFNSYVSKNKERYPNLAKITGGK